MTTWSSRLMGAALGLAGVLVLALGMAGGTHALWSAHAELPATSITSGNAELSIDAPTGLDTAALYPGQHTSMKVTVTNTSTTPLSLRVDSLALASGEATATQRDFAQALTVTVWPSATTCTTPPAAAWTSTTPDTRRDLGVTLAPGNQQVLCLATTLSTKAPTTVQGARIDLALTLEGLQP